MSKTAISRRIQQEADRAEVRGKQHEASIAAAALKEEERADEAAAIASLPEEHGLLTKRHLRYALRNKASGDRLGATIDRLPIHHGAYHQADAREPKAIEFEAALPTLVERYGVDGAFDHMSLGQLIKYSLVHDSILNVKTGEQEWPAVTKLDLLRARIQKMKHHG